MNVSELTLELCKIDSTTGQEGELSRYTGKLLENLGFRVKFQEVESNRLNLLATPPGATPKVLLTTHLDNVIADKASSICVMRATVDESSLQKTIKSIIGPSTNMKVLTTKEIPNLENCIVRFGSDVPHLSSIGTPILFGPGSILDAHTAHEKITVSELEASVHAYKTLCEHLIQV